MRQTNTVISQCKICGAPARYSYYGAVVCQSCKMFFKRNAEHGQVVLRCNNNSQCELTIGTRHKCQSCRLAKCFANGMSTELIRSCIQNNKINPREKLINETTLSKTTVLARSGEKHPTEQLPTLNLLRSDQSSLTLHQWNLLSNLVHCFDEYSGYSSIEHFIRDQNSLPAKLRFRHPPVSDYFASIMTKVQLVFEKNRDFLSLSSHDHAILFRSTVEYTTSVGGLFTLRQHQLFEYPAFYHSVEMVFRPTAAAFSRRVIDQLDPDDTFIKLILAALAFSTINYTVYTISSLDNLTNVKAILNVQDMYTELTWRYLLYKYGHHQAVIRFLNLIRCLFLAKYAIVEAHESKQFTEIIDSVIEQTEQKLCI